MYMNRCIICHENDIAKYAFYPCGHYGICSDCKTNMFNQVGNWVCSTCDNTNPNETLYCVLCNSHIYNNIRYSTNCPICRKVVKNFLKIFFS